MHPLQAEILSRGYVNCRITSTATRNVWWVQYFNSQETLILNTIEISGVPEVACAAQEDIDDSAQRLLPPGTPFSQLPDHWTCPECDASKRGFMVIED
jgi:rubredoxin